MVGRVEGLVAVVGVLAGTSIWFGLCSSRMMLSKSRYGRDERRRPEGLSDVQLASFVARGYLVIDVDELDPSFHEGVAAEAEMYEDANPGNNILPAMPQLEQVLSSRAVAGALRSVLGASYATHAHRHLHFSNGGGDQKWHKDSMWGTRGPRHARPRWCMALYYPRKVTLDMGPTVVMPYSQYVTIDTESAVDYGEDRLGNRGAVGSNRTTQYAGSPGLAQGGKRVMVSHHSLERLL